MTMKAAEKIIDALTQLMQGYTELQQAIESDLGSDEEEYDESSSELHLEIDAAIVAEMRAALESVIETEDCTAEDIAAAISTMTDALEEIDPDVFVADEEEAGQVSYEADDDEYYDEEDDDFEDDDFDDLDEEDLEEDDDVEDGPEEDSESIDEGGESGVVDD